MMMMISLVMTSVTLMITAIYLVMKKSLTVLIEWKLMSTTKMSFYLMLDMKSIIFATTVMLITLSIVIYTKFYINKKKTMFTKIILVFVISMIMVIFSPSMVSMIMGWEGLGMSSFILIMFYQNKKSMMSSMYTMMMNRMGDATLIISMMMMMNVNSWMFMTASFQESKLWIILLMISMFSKSAQIPFSSWLTEAMAAPTPVSALVHSSTLVTAGIYLMLRFEPKIKYTNLNNLIFYISMMTLVMASLNSLTQWDIKKLVALSTLAQLSIMFIAISMNMYKLAFFHMIMHATFKALIFLCSSTLISMSNTQDLRKISSTSKNSVITLTSFNTANMILCSIPFSSSFYSKELIMEMMMINSINNIMTILFLMTILTTMIYSFKMVMIINMTKPNVPITVTKEETSQKTSKLVLLLPSIILGNNTTWTLNTSPEIMYITKMEKSLPLIMIFTTILVMTLHNLGHKTKIKNNKLNQFSNYMWFMKTVASSLKMVFMVMILISFKTTEKGVLMMESMSFKKMTMKLLMDNFLMTQFKFKTIILAMIMISMLVF
uniref:NADH:ubiquinone reductase (H(+)-translocating) n=1 Tax=Bemisia afer TaxID=166114 RepID=A0A0U2GSF8_BEMAF|nr:NADH dehydrogenase subunit 5 [Bemisia afer]